MKKTTFQLNFINEIKEKMDEPKLLVDVVMDLLNISKDSAYRRIRGVSTLSFDETVTLAHHFRIPLDEVANNEYGNAIFQKQPFIKGLEGYREYMINGLKLLKEIQSQKNHMVYFLAKDIPPFYYYALPKLTAFKIYVWFKSVYGIDKIDGENYNLSMIPNDIIEVAKQQHEVYSRINSTEIWSDTTISSVINQIEYYYEAGFFSNKEEVLEICDEFRMMMKIVYKQALYGQKVHSVNTNVFSPAAFHMYFHEILLMDNHILVEYAEDNISYFIPYAGANYLSTSDRRLTADLKEFVDMQMAKAASMDTISEKERNKFFIRMKNRIDSLKEKILSTDPFL